MINAYEMTGLVGATFYDSLNKLVIGFLFLLPFLAIYMPSSNVMLMIWSIVAWLIGIMVWGLCECLSQNCKGFDHIYPKNDEKLIKQVYDEILSEYRKNDIELPEELPQVMDRRNYFNAYFCVEKNGLLGNVPVMESYSAFFFYMRIVLIWWILLLICSNGATLCYKVTMDYSWTDFSCVLGNPKAVITVNPLILILICGVMWWLSFPFRNNTERQIYHNVLDAYVFLKIDDKRKESSNKNTEIIINAKYWNSVLLYKMFLE